MIKFDAASLSYGGTVALAGIDLTLAAGEQVCLIGPSGAGKSSLMALMNGRRPTTNGKVLLRGKDLATLSAKELKTERSRIAWVPQDLGLVPNLRVNQNIACGKAAAKGFGGLLRSLLFMKKNESEEIHRLLKRVGIPEKLYARTDHLSGGQQQRVAIARALFQEPEIILADEPVSAVDPERARSVVELLTNVAREEKATLVMSLHDVDLAQKYFDRVIGMREGKIIFDGCPKEVGMAELYRLES